MTARATYPQPERARIEATIEALLAILDDMDGDFDLEDGDEDRCSAFEDFGSALVSHGDGLPGDPEDAEHEHEGGYEHCPPGMMVA